MNVCFARKVSGSYYRHGQIGRFDFRRADGGAIDQTVLTNHLAALSDGSFLSRTLADLWRGQYRHDHHGRTYPG